MSALSVVLLAVGLVGALLRPRSIPAWTLPLAAACVAVLFGIVDASQLHDVLRPLAAPLAFVAVAVPLAASLDEVGVFDELAAFAARTRHVVGAEEGVARLVEMLARGEKAKRDAQPGSMVDDDGVSYTALIERLHVANEKMLAAIRGLPADADKETRSPHPFFGELNCYEWAVFQRIHDSDHIQHAQKIVAATGGV